MRSKNLRRGSQTSIYVDSTPAGDPTYDPCGTSRPFRPTHKTRAPKHNRTRTSYLDVERRNPARRAEHPMVKVLSALRQTLEYKFEESNPLEKVRKFGYAGAGIVAAVCILVLGTSLLAKQFPMTEHGAPITTETAAATTDQDGNSISSTISAPASQETVIGAPANIAGQPSSPMVDGIAGSTMLLYVKAAQTCKMPWQILAAVGRVETNHGTSDAAGVNDGQNFAGAKGPMQFMQATWDTYGLDANHDGKTDIYDQTDAVYSAASYLCANGASASANIDNALYHYNHSASYVSLVKQTAQSYVDSSYRTPLPVDAATNAELGETHHDYPASDIPVPQGTPVFAVHKGSVTVIKNNTCGDGIELLGTDGVKYMYCHASQINTQTGASVDAGTLIMLSGGTPDTEGAGDATGPHLHLEVEVNGNQVCPQSMLQNWMSGKFSSPMNAPSTGCVG